MQKIITLINHYRNSAESPHDRYEPLSDYNPCDIEYEESESFQYLQNYLSKKGYAQTLFTQVSLIKQAYPPFQIVYGYDLDLSEYGFNITQYVTVPETKEIGQADEMGVCPLPG